MNTNAWSQAIAYATKLALAPDCPWVFCITNEDRGDEFGNAVFNIWAVPGKWPALRVLLTVGDPNEWNNDSISWHFEGLTLSFISPEAHAPQESDDSE